MEKPKGDDPHPLPWPQVSEQTPASYALFELQLVVAAHDHLQRGTRRREWWADRLPAPQPDEPSGGG
jgi:hypothetical protein